MPSGACVVRRERKRGAVWSLKFADADGRQCWERLGRETDGWTRQKAERELGKRLQAVERDRGGSRAASRSRRSRNAFGLSTSPAATSSHRR